MSSLGLLGDNGFSFADLAEDYVKGPPHYQIMHEFTDYQERADISMMPKFNNYYEFNGDTITTKKNKITFIINLESYKQFYLTLDLNLLTKTIENYYECVIYSYAVSNAIHGIPYYFNITNDTINRLTHQLREWFDYFRYIRKQKQDEHGIYIYVWDNIFLPNEIQKAGFFGNENKTITFECCYDLSNEKKINDFFDTKLTDSKVQNDQKLEEEFIKKYRERQQQLNSNDCFGPGCIVAGGKLRKRKNNKTYNKSKSHNRRRRRTHRRK